MSISTEEMELETTIPIDISIFKPYCFSLTPIGSERWDRVFTLHTGNPVHVVVEQPIKPSRQLKVKTYSENPLSAKEKDEIGQRLKLELGTDERLRELKVLAARDSTFKKALFSSVGFRLFANSSFDEAFLYIVFSKFMAVPENHLAMKRFIETHGTPLSWNSKRFEFPSRDYLLSMTKEDWKKLRVKGGVSNFMNSIQKIEEAEIYTYYPVPERGFSKLKYISGIGNFVARALMTFCARNYQFPIYDQLTADILHDLYAIPDAVSLSFFDEFMKRFDPVPGLAIHVLATYQAPLFLRKIHEEFDLYS
ncbi:MAG: hypothetical protein D6732_00840 [Methanobacteriota archaeon]|nr:MAG: hypothetical protein D6732_00840 [Euryarchaeota archaeon]